MRNSGGRQDRQRRVRILSDVAAANAPTRRPSLIGSKPRVRHIREAGSEIAIRSESPSDVKQLSARATESPSQQSLSWIELVRSQSFAGVYLGVRSSPSSLSEGPAVRFGYEPVA